MEPLKDFIKALSDDSARAAFAAECNTSVGHLRNVAYEFRTASPELRAAIEKASKGAIRCEDWPEQFPLNRIKDAAWPWHPKGRPVVDITKVAA